MWDNLTTKSKSPWAASAAAAASGNIWVHLQCPSMYTPLISEWFWVSWETTGMGEDWDPNMPHSKVSLLSGALHACAEGSEAYCSQVWKSKSICGSGPCSLIMSPTLGIIWDTVRNTCETVALIFFCLEMFLSVPVYRLLEIWTEL